MPSNLRNWQTVFQNYGTILQSHQQWMRISNSPHLCLHLLWSILILDILVGMEWYVIVFFDLHFPSDYSLMILSIFLCAGLPLRNLLFRNVYSDPLLIFELRYLCFFIVIRIIYKFWIQATYQVYEFQIFSSISGVSSFLVVFFEALTLGHEDLPVCFLVSVL